MNFKERFTFLKNKLDPDSLIRVLDSTHDLYSSLKLFRWASLQKRFQHNADTCCQIILKLGMAGMIEEMEGFCQEMVKEQCPGSEEALLTLIDSFVRNNRLNEALQVLAVLGLGRYKTSVGVYNVLLGALVEEKKDLKSVSFVYKEIVKVGIVPTVETLNYLLEALFEADQVDIALDQYRRMRKKGCCPNSSTYEIVINSLIDRNQEDESIVVLGEMFELCVPELEFYTRIISQFCRINKLEVGMQLFETMRASKIVPDSQTYDVLIQYLCENLRVDDAIALLVEIKGNNLTPSDHVFVDIINGLCISNKLNEATKFLEDGYVLDTLSHNALLEGYCNAGNILGPKELFDRMEEMNIADSMSWNNLFRCIAQNTGIHTTLEFIGRMIVEGCPLDVEAYCILIKSMSAVGRTMDCVLFLNLMVNEGLLPDPETLADLLSFLAKQSQFHIILLAVDKFISKYEILSPAIFNTLINGLWKEGYKSEACRLLDIMLEKGWVPDASTHGLLMGSSVGEETDNKMCTYKNFQVQDNISSILAEGLAKTLHEEYE